MQPCGQSGFLTSRTIPTTHQLETNLVKKQSLPGTFGHDCIWTFESRKGGNVRSRANCDVGVDFLECVGEIPPSRPTCFFFPAP